MTLCLCLGASDTHASIAGQPLMQPGRGVGHVGHERRNRALLESLSAWHPLIIRGHALPHAARVRIATSAGDNLTCNFEAETLNKRREALLDVRAGQPARSATTSRGRDDAQQHVEDITPSTFQEALSPLAGACAELSDGWWTYRWCHRDEIRQFHREPDGSVGQDWSLGRFVASKSPNEPIGDKRYHSHFFEGGQRCDETGTGRKTEVRFFCCDAQGSGIASVQSVDEPELCSYTLVLCSLFTCLQQSQPKAPSFRRLLAPLEGSCFQRVENWWTYEFCFGHYVRQFHQEVVSLPDGGTRTRIEGQYMLGRMASEPPPPFLGPGARQEASRFNRQAAVDLAMPTYVMPDGGEPTELPFVSLHKQKDPRQSFLMYRFINGSECGLTGRNRTTDVKVFCLGTDEEHDKVLRHAFEGISEVSTCHYEVIMRTSTVCKHPAFAVNNLPDITVECLLDQDSADQLGGSSPPTLARTGGGSSRPTSSGTARATSSGTATATATAGANSTPTKRGGVPPMPPQTAQPPQPGMQRGRTRVAEVAVGGQGLVARSDGTSNEAPAHVLPPDRNAARPLREDELQTMRARQRSLSDDGSHASDGRGRPQRGKVHGQRSPLGGLAPKKLVRVKDDFMKPVLKLQQETPASGEPRSESPRRHLDDRGARGAIEADRGARSPAVGQTQAATPAAAADGTLPGTAPPVVATRSGADSDGTGGVVREADEDAQ